MSHSCDDFQTSVSSQLDIPGTPRRILFIKAMEAFSVTAAILQHSGMAGEGVCPRCYALICCLSAIEKTDPSGTCYCSSKCPSNCETVERLRISLSRRTNLAPGVDIVNLRIYSSTDLQKIRDLRSQLWKAAQLMTVIETQKDR